MFRIGCHLSIAKGYVSMGKDALKIGAKTFQFFTRNPCGGKAKPIDEKDMEALRVLAGENDLADLIAHAPYILNACSPKKAMRAYAREIMRDDLARLEHLPGNRYSFHPGTHGGQGIEIGIAHIAELLNTLLDSRQSTIVLLETMSGRGTEIGGTFEELRAILDQVHLREKMGICLDTCHIFTAGYDIVRNLDGVLGTFDRILGLDSLKAIHLNDSMKPLGSHQDRHARIGEGEIGLEAITRIINHPALKHLPFYLETPQEDTLSGYGAEIRLLQGLYVD